MSSIMNRTHALSARNEEKLVAVLEELKNIGDGKVS